MCNCDLYVGERLPWNVEQAQSTLVSGGEAKKSAPGATSPFLNGQQAVPAAAAAALRSPIMTNADNRPYLWTVDNSPIYGSPNGAGQGPVL